MMLALEGDSKNMKTYRLDCGDGTCIFVDHPPPDVEAALRRTRTRLDHDSAPDDADMLIVVRFLVEQDAKYGWKKGCLTP